LRSGDEVPVDMELDFLQEGPAIWDIHIETGNHRLLLAKGGSIMQIDDGSPVESAVGEYPNLYAAFSRLVRERRIDVDCAPLRLVADAFMCGRRHIVEAFEE
jgi:hypothetical protein